MPSLVKEVQAVLLETDFLIHQPDPFGPVYIKPLTKRAIDLSNSWSHVETNQGVVLELQKEQFFLACGDHVGSPPNALCVRSVLQAYLQHHHSILGYHKYTVSLEE